MRDCKDCIHYAVCRDWYGSENGMPNYADDIDCRNYEAQPTAQERPHGHWIVHYLYPECHVHGWDYRCDQCKTYHDYDTNFCPECGAEMEGASDG